MRKLLYLTALVLAGFFAACSNDNETDLDKYADWRIQNENWVNSLATKTEGSGTPVYTRAFLPQNPTDYVLMRRIGETHTGNLVPLYTSTTSVNYEVRLMNDTLIDKGTAFASELNSYSLIAGWSIAQLQMHVGDSCEFIMPQEVAYGQNGSGTVPPYSALRFNIRLVDILHYETKP